MQEANMEQASNQAADPTKNMSAEQPDQTATEQASGKIAAACDVLRRLSSSVGQQVIGRDDVIELVVIALMADGHVLLEDFPGSGKTTLAKALGETIVDDRSESDIATDEVPIAAFRRVQFTPDLLPADVTGSAIFDASSNAFQFRFGPVFTHVLLADEINRTSPKVQSALLEAMGEKQVTVDNRTYPLDDLFFVIATQNPLDLVGTYPLPTPQLDRFLFKITMSHIDRDAELSVLDTWQSRRSPEHKIQVSRQHVLAARRIIDKEVYIADSVKQCLVDISRQIRDDDRVIQGNSTRSLVLLLPALQVRAAMDGRDYVNADDIEFLLPHVLGHRVELAPGAGSFSNVLQDCMKPAMETLARSTMKPAA
jgi:MoxR-like ATPase